MFTDIKKAWRGTRAFFVARRSLFVAMFVVMAFASVSMAQGDPPSVDIDLDLTSFWNGFNTFFNALFPPMAFIASIGAAIGFIFMVVNALVRVFRSGGFGRN